MADRIKFLAKFDMSRLFNVYEETLRNGDKGWTFTDMGDGRYKAQQENADYYLAIPYGMVVVGFEKTARQLEVPDEEEPITVVDSGRGRKKETVIPPPPRLG